MLRRALSFTAVLLAASPAFATSVFLNGVAVDGLANQKFSGATVTFDAQGNVHIDAPGIEVKTMSLGGSAKPAAASATATAQPPAKPTKHYFLVPQQAVPGMAGYDIDVWVNGQYVTKFRNDDQPNPLDVTKYVNTGANKVTFTAHKTQGERKSFSPAHTTTVMVGEGMAGGDQVVIDNPLLTFKRTAADTDDVTEEYTFNAH